MQREKKKGKERKKSGPTRQDGSRCNASNSLRNLKQEAWHSWPAGAIQKEHMTKQGISLSTNPHNKEGRHWTTYLRKRLPSTEGPSRVWVHILPGTHTGCLHFGQSLQRKSGGHFSGGRGYSYAPLVTSLWPADQRSPRWPSDPLRVLWLPSHTRASKHR